MVCVSGWAGTGKDECAGRLVKIHGAVHTGLADPGKRHMKDAYGFSDEQLWGPSAFRNAGDRRYPKPVIDEVRLRPWEGDVPDDIFPAEDDHGRPYVDMDGKPFISGSGPVWCSSWLKRNSHIGALFTNKPYQINNKDAADLFRFFAREGDSVLWLSPRESLQKYMELMNTLYADTWIRKGIEDHRMLAAGRCVYSKSNGITLKGPPYYNSDFGSEKLLSITCFSDFRHIHEHRLAKNAADETLVPVLIRIKRPTVTKPPFNHRSETEQTRIRDAAYDFIINNDSTLDDLYNNIDIIVKTCSSPSWVGKNWDPSFVLPELQETYIP
jgi:hypothetical protein